MYIFDIKFGAEVYGRDKACGRLTGAVVKLATQQVTDLIIESGVMFNLFKRTTLVPVSQIEDTTCQAAYLTAGSSELANFPEYDGSLAGKSSSGWPAVPAADSVVSVWADSALAVVPETEAAAAETAVNVPGEYQVLTAETAVFGLEGSIGRLAHLIVDGKDFHLKQLVVLQGTVLPEEFLVPASLVEAFAETGVQVNATHMEVDEFPEFVASGGFS